jgi:hypothetical protein
MEIGFDLINGCALGIEYVPAYDEDESNTVILDLFVIRLLFFW